jgi:hypothetical protein
MFGAFLVGLVTLPPGPQAGFWAHNATAVTAEYEAGWMRWTVSDESLPGVELSIAALPASEGKGMLVDVNVTGAASSTTTASASAAYSGGVELVWAFGCGQPAPSGRACGWAYDPMVIC